MTKVIGVRFRTAGKIYFFDPMDFEIKRGDHVIVETARGIEFGTVMSGVTEVEDDKVVQPLKPVLRLANQRDIEQEASNKLREKEAFKVCLEKIKKHELDMKLIDAEYTFDNNKVLFYFTADGRIDFRDLVKDLAGVFKTRIELRQIGVRDETKIVGGIGICGRPLCCHSYLADFVPVSIKMAKEQNLSLNPTKISGMCGRLMCCLKNEEETYEELNRKLPGVGDYVITPDGLRGEVHSVNVLRQLVKVIVESGDEKEIKEYAASKLQLKRKKGRKEKLDLSKEEMQELERLEEEELQEEEEAQGSRKGDSGQRQGRNRQGEGRQNDASRAGDQSKKNVGHQSRKNHGEARQYEGAGGREDAKAYEDRGKREDTDTREARNVREGAKAYEDRGKREEERAYDGSNRQEAGGSEDRSGQQQGNKPHREGRGRQNGSRHFRGKGRNGNRPHNEGNPGQEG